MTTEVSALDKSLDDIIAAKPKGSRRGGNSNPRRAIIGNVRTSSPVTRRPAPASGTTIAPPSHKIIVSNLPVDVSKDEVSELFSSTVGTVREVTLNYDEKGQSKGTATVTFVRSGDSTKAFNQYNNRLIDGRRTMRIEVVYDPGRSGAAPTLAQRVGGVRDETDSRPRRDGGGGPRGRGTGRGRGRGGRRGNERPAKSAADLDAEMEDYVSGVGPDEETPEAAA